MGFDRPQRCVQELGRLDVRKARAVAQGNADPFGLGQALQRLVQVQPGVRRALRRLLVEIGGLVGQRLAEGALDPLQIEPRRDPFQPGLEGPLAAEFRNPFEGRQAGVLGDVVGQGRIGAHAPDQGAHSRAVAAHQLAESGALPRARQGGELHVVKACDVGDVSHRLGLAPC